MSLNCNQDGLLKKVDDAKKALKDKLASIKLPSVDVNAVLAQVAADAEQLKKDLLSAVPDIPKLPDFQQELDALKSKIAARLPGWEEDLAKLEKNWGGAIDDISNIVGTLGAIAQNPLKALDFDICKQEDVELNADGTKKEKPIEAVDDTTSGEEEKKPDAVLKTSESTLPSASGSDVGLLAFSNASDILNTAITNAMAPIRTKQKEARKELSEISIRNYIGKVRRKLPKNFFANPKYLNAQPIEYFLINDVTSFEKFGPDVKAPDKYYLLRNKILNYSNIVGAVESTQKMIMTFFNEGGETKFSNITTAENKLELSEHYYNTHGYGLKLSGYGYDMASNCVSKEAKQRVLSAFKLSAGDYTTSKIPYHYNISDYITGGSGVIEQDFKSITQDLINAMFEAKTADGFQCLAIIAAYNHKSILSEIESTMPSTKDFMVKGLGGNVENYESTQKFQTSDIAEEEQSGNYTEDNFSPHWMFLNVDFLGKGIPGSVYANTFQEHEELKAAGYTH